MLINDGKLDMLVKQAMAAFNALTTEEQKAHRREQAISWAYGQLCLSGIEVTKEQVAKAYDERH